VGAEPTRDFERRDPAERSALLAELARGRVHLWHIDQDEVTAPDVLAACEALMTPEERDRHRRFKVEHARHEFLVTRLVVRTVLSRYADVDPAAWRFECNEQGKPAIAGPADVGDLRFNLSNTRGRVICGVAAADAIGVDVENMAVRGETVNIADRYFSAAEVEALNALPESRQPERFFRYWTLKESYIKARGLGLSIPLERFSFALDTPGPIRIAFDERLAGQDDATRWRFWQGKLSDRHMAAVAVRQARGGRAQADLDVRVEAFSPPHPGAA